MKTITILEPNFSTMSDKDLLKLCQEYGGNCRMWKRKFEELLPEVLKRRLYKKHKFVSIYEFAAKLCGLSHESVDNVIRVYEQLKDKPVLRSLVVEFGWSKLRIVSGIATKETDASWAEKVRVLPKSSLEVFVRDLKRQEERKRIEAGQQDGGQCSVGISDCKSENATIATLLSTEQGKLTDQQGLFHHQSLVRPIFPGENLQFSGNSGQNNGRSTMSFKLNPEIEFRLRKLKVRIEKGKKEKISFNQLFEIMLGVVENKERVVRKPSGVLVMSPLKLCKV